MRPRRHPHQVHDRRHLRRCAPADPELPVPATSTGAGDGAAARSRANTYPAAVLALGRPELDDELSDIAVCEPPGAG
jgi:hypothetical protein